jgi:N-methylhydantoinase B/oxoprolinase/acetone carboxylase alpha subunit
MMIYEVCDFCTALTDARGQLISQNVGGVSHFVADLGVIIKDVIAREGPDGFDSEDAFITNHQRVAGQHLNNVVIYMPFLHMGKLMGFAMTRAHWIDVGGSSTGLGASPVVSDPWSEGLQIDQLRIYEAGKNSPIESMEIKTPVIVEERSLRPDSGGGGRFRGGLGIDVRVRNLVEGKWNLARPRRRKCPPWGLWNGGDGGGAEYFLRLAGSDEFNSVDQIMRPVPALSEVIIRTGGGGGWGDPFERDPDAVLIDVLEGLVSVEAAKQTYGVVIEPTAMRIDDAATRLARAGRTGSSKA